MRRLLGSIWVRFLMTGCWLRTDGPPVPRPGLCCGVRTPLSWTKFPGHTVQRTGRTGATQGSGTGLPGPSHPQPACFCSHSARRDVVASGKSPGFDTRCGAIIIIFNYTTVPLPGRHTGRLSPLLTRVVPFPFISTDINSTHALGISEL